ERELVRVERAPGRPCGAVPFGVVLAAVARTAEPARREHLDQRYFLAAAGAVVLRVVGEARPVRLDRAPEVCAPVRDDREARLAADLAVVTDVRRAPGDLSLVGREEEVRDLPLVLGKVADRAEIDVVLSLLAERGPERGAEDGNRDDGADHAAETERRTLEEPVSREPLARLRRRHRRLADVRGRRRFGASRLLGYGFHVLLRLASILASRVAHPEERK